MWGSGRHLWEQRHWGFILMDPQLPAGDYFGTTGWTPGPVIRSDKNPNFKLNFKQLTGGLFDGLYFADDKFTGDGATHRMVMLMTPQVVADEGSPQDGSPQDGSPQNFVKK